MSKLWTIGALLQWTAGFFKEKGVDTPRLDAEILLGSVLHKERIYLYAHYDEPVNPDELAKFRDMVKKRAMRLSVAHILGTQPFMGLDFKVTRDVLVPRPETEMLVETVLDRTAKDEPIHILDIGTGSGAIIVSLAHYLPQCQGTGVDISQEALDIAMENGQALDVDDRLTWLKSDLFAAVPPFSYDWLVSNPPYLTRADMAHLQPEVTYDPKGALYGGPDGLDIYRRLAAESPAYVKAGGHCAVEIGAGQAADVIAIFTAGGAYIHEETIEDYGHIERVLVFQRKEPI